MVGSFQPISSSPSLLTGHSSSVRDQPSEWPPLFESFAEAYTLTRFWFVFWPRLNLGLSDAYSLFKLLQARSDHEEQNGEEAKQEHQRRTNSWLRVLWFFVFSALYHAAGNWAQNRRTNLIPELRFVLVNFAICFVVETTVSKVVTAPGARTNSPSITTRLIGHLWVYLIFFALVPGWRWPLFWKNLLEHMQPSGRV